MSVFVLLYVDCDGGRIYGTFSTLAKLHAYALKHYRAFTDEVGRPINTGRDYLDIEEWSIDPE